MKKEESPLRPKSRKGSVKSAQKRLPQKRLQRSKDYVLCLYVSGMTERSINAIQNIRKICDEELKGRCDLHVIDIYKYPVLAKGEQIIATPTLIKKLPPPLRRFIGNLRDSERILLGLDLKRK